MQNTLDYIVIGAGQAGLASAYYLEQRKLDYVVLEASDQSAGSWPDVTLATRNPINFVPQIIGGKDIHFWVKLLGFDTLSFGKKLADSTSVLDTGVLKKLYLIKSQIRERCSNHTHMKVLFGKMIKKKR